MAKTHHAIIKNNLDFRISDLLLYLVKSTNYGVPEYAVFFRSLHFIPFRSKYYPKLTLDRSKESVQVRSPVQTISLHAGFSQWGVISPPPNSQAIELPLVVYPPQLVQYVLSYPPYLAAVSSIRKLRTSEEVVTTDSLNMDWQNYGFLYVKDLHCFGKRTGL
jgi:hypothetical protein